MNFTSDVVIGLEIHVGINTASKLFCSCPNKKTSEANVHICPICLGHPGARPRLNKKALESSIKFALALHCDIAKELLFSRKIYFYPDLVKNFQTTQYEEPLGKNGYVMVEGRKIDLERIHMEEDPGALIHQEGKVLIDYNRSGTPLCELVTKPVISSAKEAREFVKKLIIILDYLDIYDVNEGIIKADLNISIKETNYTRVEIKGVSGLKDIEEALTYEIKRQQEHPNEVVQETRGYDNEHHHTFSQRLKESESDYGYIYESDIAQRALTTEFISQIKENMPESYDDKVQRYIEKGMEEEAALIICSIKQIAVLFEEAIEKIPFAFATNYFRRDVFTRVNDNTFTVEELEEKEITQKIILIGSLLSSKKINNHSTYLIFEELAKNKKLNIENFAKEKGLFIDTDLDLDALCNEVISEQANAVEDVKNGEAKALNFLVGQVMRKTKGKALPEEIKNVFLKILN